MKERKRELLTVGEACRYLGVSRATLLKTEEEGLITPTRTVGGHRRYSRKDLEQLIEALKGLRTPGQRAPWGQGKAPVLPQFVERLASSSSSPDNLVQETLQDLIRFLQADGALIALRDRKGRLQPWVSLGLNLHREPGAIQAMLTSPLSQRAQELAKPLVYEGTELGVPEIAVGMCTPLLYRGEALGIIHVLSLSRFQFLPSEVQFLSLVAVYIAALTVNSQLLAKSRRREEDLLCLNRLSQALQEQEDVTSMANHFLAEVLGITGASSGALFLCDESGMPHMVAMGGETAFPSTNERLRRLVANAVSPKGSHLSPFMPDHALGTRPPFLPSGLEGVALFPLRTQKDTVGALVLCGWPSGLGQEQKQFLETLCIQAALVFQRAILCQRLAEISESEKRFRRYYQEMVEAAPVAIEVIDRQCRIVAWNKAAEMLTGIPKEEALGADKFQLQPNLLKYRGREILDGVLNTGKVLEIKGFPYERRDGVVCYQDITFLPFVDKGEISAVIVFVQVATEVESLRQQSERTESPGIP